MKRAVLTACLLFLTPFSFAEEGSFHFQSGQTQNTLVEFYTSEVLKSCNPAEAWFNNFKNSEQCFKQVIPVSFHFNKWDDRTWKDKFAISGSSTRFLSYARLWNARGVYAPVVVINGVEWSGWAKGQAMPSFSRKVGVLSVEATQGGDIAVSFNPTDKNALDWTVHAALLGCEIESKITRGENANKKLAHEFVALAYDSQAMRKSYTSDWKARIQLSMPPGMGPKRRAVAVWITEGENPIPLQAAGRYFTA